jgi:hypothetical protein
MSSMMSGSCAVCWRAADVRQVLLSTTSAIGLIDGRDLPLQPADTLAVIARIARHLSRC